MSTTDKTKSKLLDSMRMSKGGVSETPAQETTSASAKPAPAKKATPKKSAAKKTAAKKPAKKAPARSKPASADKFTSSVTLASDTFRVKGAYGLTSEKITIYKSLCIFS